MDVALYLANPNQFISCYLADYQFTFADSKANHVDVAYKRMSELITQRGLCRFTHLYFGAEFCEYLLPSRTELEEYIRISKDTGLFPVFVTPVVTDYGISRLVESFDYLDAQDIQYAVVVNDYGVLTLLDTQHSVCEIIAGRVLDKTSHDPRIPEDELLQYYSPAGIRYACEPGIESGRSTDILSKMGICRFEFDLPIVGLELKSTKAHHSLYWPFHYLSTGRVCIFRSINKTGKEKFLVGDIPCNRPCKKLELELRKPLNGYHFEHGIRKSSQYLMQKGNTLFYLYENPNISQQFTQFDRIILQIL